jgi:hypothetical protein
VELDMPHTTTDESLAIVDAWLVGRLEAVRPAPR